MEKQNEPLVIGLTGAFGSGKSTAAEFFKSKGFYRIVLSSFLEKEVRRTSNKITRKLLQDVGNEWRVRFGRGILAQKSLDFLKKNRIEKGIIDGIRNVGEIETFKRNSNFVLIAIVADQEIRFNRLRGLKRREELTPDLFKKLDYRDLGINEGEAGLQVAMCIALADVFIDNNGNIKEFVSKLKKFLKNHE